VAVRALVGQAGVIHGRRLEGDVVLVAGVALPVVRNVAAVLAQGIDVVVAGGAGARGRCRMRVACRFPRGGGVAGIALRGGDDVGDRLGERALRADRYVGTAVAGGASAGGTRVVHRCRLEGGEVGMATVALRAGRDVAGRLGQRALCAY